MSELNVSEFLKLLEAKYDELSSTTSNRDGIIIETTADEMDRLQQQMGRDMAISNLDRTSTLLKSIGAAFDRIEDGVYGVCLRCEEPIAEKRLKAVPWASYCVSCQDAIDRPQTLTEDDSDTSAFAA